MKKYQDYVFTTGEYKGCTLRDVLLVDPAFLGNFYNRVLLNCQQFQKNAFTLAIEELMEDMKLMKTAQLCPICGHDEAKLFLVPEFDRIKKNLVCCFKKSCQEVIFAEKKGQLVGIHRYFILLGCLNGQQKKILTQIFQNAYPDYHLKELLA